MGESPPKQYAFAVIFSILPTVAVALRFWARKRKKAQLLWDDWAIVLALFSCIVTAMLLIVDTAAGGLGTFSVKLDGNGQPQYDKKFYLHNKVIFANRLTQILAIGPTKISVLLFYRRVFGCRKVFNILSIILLIVATGWTIAFFFSNLFERSPVNATWTQSPKIYKPANTNMYLAQCYIDVVTDVLIISLPIPIILSLTWDTSKKIGVCCIFLVGILTTAASIARTVIQYGLAHTYKRIHSQPELVANFNIYYVTPGVYWPLIEAALGIIAACLPLLRPIQEMFVISRLIDFSHKRSPARVPIIDIQDYRTSRNHRAVSDLNDSTPQRPKPTAHSWLRLYQDSVLRTEGDTWPDSSTSSQEMQSHHDSTEISHENHRLGDLPPDKQSAK